MDQQEAIQDILEIVTFIKDNVPLREEVATKEDLVNVESRLSKRIDRIESNMVTKEHLAKELVRLPTKYDLDDKLGDLKGDLVVLMRMGM